MAETEDIGQSPGKALMKKLYHLKIAPKALARLVILPGDPHRAASIAKTFLKHAQLINDYRGLDAYTGSYNGTRVSVVTSGMGAPSAAIVIEELARLGAGTIIRAGTCGGIAKKVRPADIVIPTGAGSMIGFKRAYGIGELPSVPDFRVLQHIVTAAEIVPHTQLAHAPAVHIGPIMTSDAFFAEKKDARSLERTGVLAMEMECAALFALGLVLGVRTGAVLLATGNINSTEQVMDSPPIRSSLDRMIRIALDALTSPPLS